MLKDKIDDFKDWFQHKGDDILGIERTIQELKKYQLMPRNVHDTLENLKDENNAAENAKNIAIEHLEKTIEKKHVCKSKLEQKQNMLNDKYGIFSKFLHNFIPIPFAFTRRGKEYHDLRREIRLLNDDLKFYERYANEDQVTLQVNLKYSKERKRALDQYKRIIYNKSKLYKKEFKFAKEYLDLMKMDKNKLEKVIGEQCKESLRGITTTIVYCWFDMNEIPLNFDLDIATKMLTRIRKNEKISPEEIEAFKAEILHSGPRSNNNPTQNNPNTKKDNGINIEPPIQYQDYGLDRRAVEALAYHFKDTYKTDFNLSAEEFLIVFAAAKRNNVDIKEAAEKFNKAKTQGLNTDAYVKYAPEGAQILSDMLRNYMAGTKPNKKDYEDFLVFYQKSKDTIDRYSSVKPKATTGR